MTEYKNLKKHDNPLVNKLFEEHRKLQKESVRIVQKNRKLEKTALRQKVDNKALRLKIRELMMQLKELKDIVFKKIAKKKWHKKDDDKDDEENEPDKKPKKPGRKAGHKGETRKTPDRCDVYQEVFLKECPDCHGKDLSLCQRHEDHYQEDLIMPVKSEITRFRHHYYYCSCCKKTVHGTGMGELPGSYIGPRVKALASYMRYNMSVPYRKVKDMLEKLFNMRITTSSLVGFDKQLRLRGAPIYDKLLKNIRGSSWINVDETGWKGKWLWTFSNKENAVYVVRPGRGQKDLKAVLGDVYDGVLISDLLRVGSI